MTILRNLSHTVYECKYHIVICPKHRFRIFSGEISEYTRHRSFQLCAQKDLIELLESNALEDHLHMVIFNPAQIFSIFKDGIFERKNIIRIISEVIFDPTLSEKAGGMIYAIYIHEKIICVFFSKDKRT